MRGGYRYWDVGQPAERERNGSSDHLASLGSEDDDRVEGILQSPTVAIGIDMEASSSTDPEASEAKPKVIRGSIPFPLGRLP
jgi:hypothetical protein